MNAIILHGRPGKEEYFDGNQPSASNSHWISWLQNQLMTKGIKADTPECPDAYEPQYNVWLKEVERFDIHKDTILVGHSTGGGFWIRYLSEHPDLQVRKIVLVAPWLNVKKEDGTKFFDFDFNPEIIRQTETLTILSSDNDAQDIRDSVDFLRNKIPSAKFIDFHNYGHFCYEDLGTEAFPELLEECL